MARNEEPMQTGKRGTGKSLSSQFETSICAHILWFGEGYCQTGRCSGTCQHRYYEDIYNDYRYRTQKKDGNDEIDYIEMHQKNKKRCLSIEHVQHKPNYVVT